MTTETTKTAHCGTLNKAGQLRVTIGDKAVTLSSCAKDRHPAFELRDGANIIVTLSAGMFHKVVTVEGYDFLQVWDETGRFFSRIALAGETDSQIEQAKARAARNFTEYVSPPSVPVMSSTDLESKRLDLRFWGTVPELVDAKRHNDKVIRHAYYNLKGKVAITATAGGAKNMYNLFPCGATGQGETSPILRKRELIAIELRAEANLERSLLAKQEVIAELRAELAAMLKTQEDKKQVASK